MEYSMKLLHLIFAFFSVAVIGISHAANYNLPSVVYWNSMLPKTPMPKVVKELLLYNEEWELEDKSTSVSVGKGGVNVNTGKGKPAPSGGGGGGSVNNNNNNNNKPPTNVVVGKGGVVVRTGPKNPKKKNGVYVGVTPGKSPFLYQYAAKEDQLHDNPNVALFFTQDKGLKPGSTMTLQFFITPTTTSLLPRKISESIPFSTKYIPDIYEKFSVTDPDSKEAKIIKNTIQECEEPAGIKGEEKYCATSLESMIDFTISKLGKKVTAISTDIPADADEAQDKSPQKYKVVGVNNYSSSSNSNINKRVEVGVVVCHKLNYPYAVFYCHKTQTTEAFQVSLLGADGKMVKAAAVCHKDTSQWNPKHLAFQVLNVKPGTVPVCHFLPQDHIVWVTNYN